MSEREQYPGAPKVEKGTVGGEPTKAAKERRRWAQERTERMQARLPRPVDGVTFGSGKPRKDGDGR